MKFNLKDFLELDTAELFAINGGSDCGGSSSSRTSCASSSSSNGGHSSSTSSSHSNSNNHNHNFVRGVKNDDGTYSWVYSDGCEQKFGNTSKTKYTSFSGLSGGSCSGSSGSNSNSSGSYPSPGYSYTSGGSHSGNCGGTCSGSNTTGTEIIQNEEKNPIIENGKFGQITDGSYADDLTMQYYKNLNSVDGEVSDKFMNDKKNSEGNIVEQNSFSTDGCKMSGAAKIASEITGRNISLLDINNNFDKNKDRLLIQQEIEGGLQNLLGEDYEVKSDTWKVQLTKEKLSELTSADDANTTYVLGFAPECFGGHWVVIEGWSTNENGQVVFDYDGTSDNDVGRTYVLGKSDVSKKIYGIERIETFSVSKK